MFDMKVTTANESADSSTLAAWNNSSVSFTAWQDALLHCFES